MLNPVLSAFTVIKALTLHVVALERLADVERGRAQEQVGLQRLVAPYTEIQLAEGRHDPAEQTRKQVCE